MISKTKEVLEVSLFTFVSSWNGISVIKITQPCRNAKSKEFSIFKSVLIESSSLKL